MRVEPEYGQDVPVECHSAVIEQGASRYRIIDRGDHIEIMAISGTQGLPGLIFQPQSGNVARMRIGVIP